MGKASSSFDENNKKMTESIIRMEMDISTIKNEVLPELKKDVKEARDRTLLESQEIQQLKLQLSNPEHSCFQVETLTKLDTKVRGWSRLSLVMLPILATIIFGMVGYALKDARSEASMETTLTNSTKVQEELKTNLKSLENRQRNDTDKILDSLGKLGQQVSRVERNNGLDVDDLVQELPPRERRKFHKLMKQAKDSYHLKKGQ